MSEERIWERERQRLTQELLSQITITTTVGNVSLSFYLLYREVYPLPHASWITLTIKEKGLLRDVSGVYYIPRNKLDKVIQETERLLGEYAARIVGVQQLGGAIVSYGNESPLRRLKEFLDEARIKTIDEYF